MTFEELMKEEQRLQSHVDFYNKEISKLYGKYVDEHIPEGLHRRQWLKARLRVTEEHVGSMSEAMRKKRKYQPGYEYEITGYCYNFIVGEHGDIRPCFYEHSYSRHDELLSLEAVTPPEGSCDKCYLYKGGKCYKAGGMDCESCATHRVQYEDEPCPKYEERTELYFNGKPVNATIVRIDGEKFYRIYNKNWTCYSQWIEKWINQNYTFEPPKEK